MNCRVLLGFLAQTVQMERMACQERKEKLEEKADLETLYVDKECTTRIHVVHCVVVQVR